MNKLSGFDCPKCHDKFLFWQWKTMNSVGYSCQTCGYNFMIGEIEFRTAGRQLAALVEGRATETLARKGF